MYERASLRGRRAPQPTPANPIRNPQSAIIAIGLSLALQSPDPWPVLDHPSTVYQTITSLSADFTQVVTNPMLGAPDTTRGRLYQMRPSRFPMPLTAPTPHPPLPPRRPPPPPPPPT